MGSIITPWKVEGVIDYERLVKEYGTQLIDEKILKRLETIAINRKMELHPWLRRGIFFSHRNLETFLNAYDNHEPVFLYTGRGPSNEMHIGHLIPFIFIKYLQDLFDCNLVIQIADEEKFYFKNLDMDTCNKLGYENAKDIIACGFNSDKTFIFSNCDYRVSTYQFESFVRDIKKIYPVKKVAKIFGFGKKVKTIDGKIEYVIDSDTNVGMFEWPYYQSAAAFSIAFPHLFEGKQAQCLVAYAIDQDPYFRMARDIADQMKLIKPCSIMSVFLPPLTGIDKGKMSSTNNNTNTTDITLYLTDTEQALKKKIMKYAYSGGGGNGSLEDHKKYGGNPNVDIAYQYLRYFEFDDKNLEFLKEEFIKGNITCGTMKKILIEKLVDIMKSHQLRRGQVTNEILAEFYKKK